MKRRYRVLLWAFGVVAGLVGALAVFVVFFQWNWLKAPLEARLSAATGKQVTIAGDVRGTFSWTPRVTLSDIRILAPDWTPATVGSIGKLTVAIDLRRFLFHGQIDLPAIDVDHGDFTLVRLADGRENWKIAEQASGPSNRHQLPLIGRLTIENSQASFSAPANHTSIRARIASVSGEGGAGSSPVHIDAKGQYQDAPFSLSLTADPLSQLRDTKTPYKVDLSTDLGATHIHAAGTLADPLKVTGLNMHMTIRGQDAADLYPYLGVAAPRTPPFTLDGTLDRDGDAWMFNAFKGTVGHSDLAGSLTFKTGGKPIFIGGALASNSLNLVDLGLAVGAPTRVSAGDQAVSAAQRQVAADYDKSPRVLPNAPLNLAMVQHVNADVTFKATQLVAKDAPLKDMSLRVRIDNGVLSLDPLRVGAAGGTISGGVVIDATDPRVKTDYDLHLNGFQLRDLFAKTGHPDWGSGTIEGRIRLTGYGDTVAKSLGSSSGEASILLDHGEISSLMADLMGEDLAKALGVLVTGRENRPVALNCLVGNFDVRDGVAEPQPFLIDTAKSILGLKGSIRLSNETLALQLNGYPKQATPLSLNSPLDIGGTFKKPSISPTPQTYAHVAAAALLGAFASPFASVLAFIAPGAQQNTNCAELEHAVQRIEGAATPVKPETPARSPRKTGS